MTNKIAISLAAAALTLALSPAVSAAPSGETSVPASVPAASSLIIAQNNANKRAAPHHAVRRPVAPTVRRAGPPKPPHAPTVGHTRPRTVPVRPTVRHVRPAQPHVRPRVASPRAPVRPRVAGAHHGPRIASRIGGPIRLGGRRVVIVRGPRHVYWRGRRRSLLPIAVLTGLTLGALTYSAYAYVPVAEPVCTGYTDDGCFFQWTDVPTPEGDLIPQCVAYCPRP